MHFFEAAFASRVFRKASITLASIIAVSFATLALLWLRKDIGMDFGVYWRAANEPVEHAYQQRAVLNFPYPPTMLLWIEPLAWVPKWPAFAAFTLASITSLAFACRSHLSGRGIALALASPPAVYCLINGQISLLLAAGLIWACSTADRLKAGVIFAIIGSIKPQLIIMAPLVLYRSRDWTALTNGAVALATIVGLSTAIYGFELWDSWFRSLSQFGGVVERNGVLSVTITPFAIARMHELPQLPMWAAAAAIALALMWTGQKAKGIEQAALIATASLLIAPYAIIYDLVTIVPFLVWAIFRGRLLAAIAFTGGLNPLPLLITAFIIVRNPLWLRLPISVPRPPGE